MSDVILSSWSPVCQPSVFLLFLKIRRKPPNHRPICFSLQIRSHAAQRRKVKPSLSGSRWPRRPILHLDVGSPEQVRRALRHVGPALGIEDQLQSAATHCYQQRSHQAHAQRRNSGGLWNGSCPHLYAICAQLTLVQRPF